MGDQSAGIAETAKILAGEETVGAEIAHGAAGAASIAGTDGLGGVFDDLKAVLLSEGKDSVEIGTLAEEVDGDDGFGFGGDFGFGVGQVDVEADGAGVDKDGGGADATDASSGGEEGKGGDEHFIAGADVEGHEGEKDGVGAGGDTDAMAGFG